MFLASNFNFINKIKIDNFRFRYLYFSVITDFKTGIYYYLTQISIYTLLYIEIYLIKEKL